MSHEIKHLPIFGWSERTETALWNVCNMCEMLSIIDTRFQVCKLSHSFSLLDHDSDPLCQSVDKRSQPSNRNGKLICQMNRTLGSSRNQLRLDKYVLISGNARNEFPREGTEYESPSARPHCACNISLSGYRWWENEMNDWRYGFLKLR